MSSEPAITITDHIQENPEPQLGNDKVQTSEQLQPTIFATNLIMSSGPAITITDHIQEKPEPQSGNDKIQTSEQLQPTIFATNLVMKTTPIQLLPSSEQVRMLNIVPEEVNPVPKPVRTFGSQNNLIDQEKSIPVSKTNVTPQDEVVLEVPEEKPADVNVNVVPSQKRSKSESDTESKLEQKPLIFKNPEFIPPPFPTPTTPRANSRVGKQLEISTKYYEEEEFVTTAYLTLFLVCFNLFCSIGIAIWHSKTGRFWECTATTAIILISGVIVGISFFCNPKIPKAKVWKSSKIVSFLTVVPCLLPIVLAFSNIVFATKELRNRSYQRPWSHTTAVFLVESLSLAFPQCVLQLCILMEDGDSIPSAKGLFIMFGFIVMSNAVTFARIRYDSLAKPDFMEHGANKLVRYATFLAHKLLWTVTLACVIVSFRLAFKSNKLMATVGGIFLLLFIYEIPVILSTVSRFKSFFSGSGEDLFFLLPQFTSLTFLIYWINMDPNIYHTNIGSIVLGIYFWTEMIIIIAWISASGKENGDSDFITMYPHFLGSLVAACK